jgi:hypothetical protein
MRYIRRYLVVGACSLERSARECRVIIGMDQIVDDARVLRLSGIKILEYGTCLLLVGIRFVRFRGCC